MRSEQVRAQARSWWWSAAAAVALVGWGAALLTTPPSALLASSVVVAACSLLVSTAVRTSRESRSGVTGPVTADWRALVDHTLLGTLGAIAALGLLQVSVTATFLLALFLGSTAAWAFSWHPAAVVQQASPGGQDGSPGRGAQAVPAAPTAAPVPEPWSEPWAEPWAEHDPATDAAPLLPPQEVGAMTTTELVLAWRRSYSELAAVRSPQQLATLAVRRQQLIDELERRDGPGIERWLRSGARAASDPSRYLQRPTGPSAASA